MTAGPRRLGPFGAACIGGGVVFGLFALLGVSFGRTHTLDSALLLPIFATLSTATLAAIVWQLCRRRPWPLHPTADFYLLHLGLAIVASTAWNGGVRVLYAIWRGDAGYLTLGDPPLVAWQLFTGLWIYGVLAGVSYAVQTRRQLHGQALAAARAEAAAADARLDAIRARLNPHFMLNALHSLGALVRAQPEQAEAAIDRLGELLRHVLREDGRALVELSEELGFSRRYLEFEAIRLQGRLRYEIAVDPACEEFAVPPFAVQTLAENAVRHAVALRPDGATIAIRGERRGDRLLVTVRDDGPGERELADAPSPGGFGLRALRARLLDAFGERADLRTRRGPDGFEVQLELPAPPEDDEEAGP